MHQELRNVDDLFGISLRTKLPGKLTDYVIQFGGETPPLRIALRWFVIELDRKFFPVIV